LAEHLGLSHQVFFAGLVEIGMIAMTLILLDVPNFFLPFSNPTTRAVLKNGGLVMLCLTFCWSVVLGCVLALNAGTYTL
jgi:hypothetical protein